MPQSLVSFGAIVLLLGGLIFVHELGHFVVAKLLGVKVVRFSIGFGPRLFGFRRGETEYRISALPLGGYVKMAGDDPSEVPAPEDRGRGFLEQAPWRRLLIAAAGPAMNLVFPAVVYFALTLSQNGQETAAAVVGTVTPGSAAERAGLQPGDEIRSVTGPDGAARPVRWFTDLSALVAPHPGVPLRFEVERGGKLLPPLTITPMSDEDSNPIETTERGVIGVTAQLTPALVAPVVPGAAGPLQPFDLVVAAGGKPVTSWLELKAVLAAAPCQPVDLTVLREAALAFPGANLARYDEVPLAGVPTCGARGEAALKPAEAHVSTFLGSVEPGSPAEQAGLRRGDAIVAANGKPILALRDDFGGIRFEAGVPVQLKLADGRDVTLTPGKLTRKSDITGKEEVIPVVGFYPGQPPPVVARALVEKKVTLDRGALECARLAVEDLHRYVRMTVIAIVRILRGQWSAENVGGPLMLFKIAREAAAEGWGMFLAQMALISVNLALMNLLPIPVLDGGHIAQALVEAVTRRPLSIRARETANIVGFILLVLLMVFVFKNDITRQLRPPVD
jgi:regulator of sigma E protease